MATLDKQIFIQQVTKDSEAEGGIITTDQLQTIILNNLKNFDMVRENNGRVSLDYLEAFINAKFIEGRTHKTLKRYDYIIKRMLNLLNTNEQDITVYHLRKYFTNLFHTFYFYFIKRFSDLLCVFYRVQIGCRV